jgi:hypothetical protein
MRWRARRCVRIEGREWKRTWVGGFVPSVEAVGNRGAIGVEEPINRPEEVRDRTPQTVSAGIVRFLCAAVRLRQLLLRLDGRDGGAIGFTYPTPPLIEISQAGPTPFVTPVTS